jgi:hypothetical protein
MSTKKLLKGHGDLATRKVILWIIDTIQVTIELTEQRLQKLLESLQNTKTWQKVLGELRFMAPAIAGSRGLFGPQKKVLLPISKRIHLTIDAHDFLDDFRWLARNLHERLTSFFELVPAAPKVPQMQAASASEEFFSYHWNNQRHLTHHTTLMYGATASLTT